MLPALRPAVWGAALLLLAGCLTACSLMAVSGDRTPGDGAATVRPPKQVLLSAAQALDDVGGAQVQTVEEGPAGRRTASGTVIWGAKDAVDLTVTDESGTGRLQARGGALDLAYGGAPAKRAERADAESLDPRAPGAAYAGGWLSGLVANPGGPAHAMALAGKLTSLGGEQLAGGTVAHYRATAPVAEYFGADEGLGPDRLAVVLAYQRQQGVTTIGYDFWVAPGNRLVRLRATVQGSAGTVVTTTDVSEAAAATETPAATG
ncbi:hypothetical protein [Streptomyces sp. CB01881]|uniref:hypothetical protein n=1 Tax=Streptomyces sp. CB01881 TaxID=2078691 RepID=UPI000CDC8748|nr:hypothetical protein [Streptomyces sp. CB01881]AUY51289.1 hypothetical protein C2142_22750 [Streptomyces sp. CB01881]TYC74675.1 hypothetical protein EH183_22725 [Streptomyces sp. CB01881]